jgi:hypothetical protein
MRSAAAVVPALLALLGACVERSNVPVPGTAVSQAPSEDLGRAWDGVVFRIVEATCDREQSCGSVGPGAYFHSREECTANIRARTVRGLNPQSCPGGVDQGVLEACLESLQAGECTAAGETVVRASSCAPSDLCLR